jgi:hypothetical protein
LTGLWCLVAAGGGVMVAGQGSLVGGSKAIQRSCRFVAQVLDRLKQRVAEAEGGTDSAVGTSEHHMLLTEWTRRSTKNRARRFSFF